MKKKAFSFKWLMVIIFLSLSLINLTQLMSFECGPTEICTTEAWGECEVLCGSIGECKKVELIYAFCDEGPCSEDYRYECYTGEYDFLYDCLGNDPRCPLRK
jgi:hypothetical protein